MHVNKLFSVQYPLILPVFKNAIIILMRQLSVFILIVLFFSSKAQDAAITDSLLSPKDQSWTYLGFSLGGSANSAYIEHTAFTVNLVADYTIRANAGVVLRHFPDHRKGILNTGLQMSLNYAQKGWTQEFFTLPGQSATTNLDYLNLPVEAIIYAGKPANRIYINLGLYAEMLVNYSAAVAPDSLGVIEDFYTYQDSRDKRFGYGLKAGAGFQKEFNFGALYLEAYFAYSLSNFINSEILASEIPDLSNLYTIGVNVGYLISLSP